jgi:hypothetical protein
MPFIPGKSGNPSGRPPGGGGMAKKIRERFGQDLRRLIDYAEAMLEDPATPHAVRKGLLEFLADRAIGKPMTQLELTATLAPAPPPAPEVDYSKLSVEELEALERMMVKLLPEPASAHGLTDVASDGIIDEQ